MKKIVDWSNGEVLAVVRDVDGVAHVSAGPELFSWAVDQNFKQVPYENIFVEVDSSYLVKDFDDGFAFNEFKQVQSVEDYFRNFVVLEVKGNRAIWDPNSGPSGAWRCPPGTLNGGEWTNRMGTNCNLPSLGPRLGARVARRLGRAISDASKPGDGNDDSSDNLLGDSLETGPLASSTKPSLLERLQSLLPSKKRQRRLASQEDDNSEPISRNLDDLISSSDPNLEWDKENGKWVPKGESNFSESESENVDTTPDENIDTSPDEVVDTVPDEVVDTEPEEVVESPFAKSDSDFWASQSTDQIYESIPNSESTKTESWDSLQQNIADIVKNAKPLSREEILKLDLHSEFGPWGPKDNKKSTYGVIYIDEDGKILLREPLNHWDEYHWTFSKGNPDKLVDENGYVIYDENNTAVLEHPLTTALREGEEETGEQNPEIIGFLPLGHSSGNSTSYFIIARPVGVPGLHDDETSDVQYFSPKQALSKVGETTNDLGRQRDLGILAQINSSLKNGTAIKPIESFLFTPLKKSALKKNSETVLDTTTDTEFIDYSKIDSEVDKINAEKIKEIFWGPEIPDISYMPYGSDEKRIAFFPLQETLETYDPSLVQPFLRKENVAELLRATYDEGPDWGEKSEASLSAVRIANLVEIRNWIDLIQLQRDLEQQDANLNPDAPIDTSVTLSDETWAEKISDSQFRMLERFVSRLSIETKVLEAKEKDKGYEEAILIFEDVTDQEAFETLKTLNTDINELTQQIKDHKLFPPKEGESLSDAFVAWFAEYQKMKLSIARRKGIKKFLDEIDRSELIRASKQKSGDAYHSKFESIGFTPTNHVDLINQPDEYGLARHSTVEGLKKIDSQAKANAHIAEGGALSDVSDKFLEEALRENMGKRFAEIPTESGVNDWEGSPTIMFKDSTNGRIYILKRPVRNDKEFISEISANTVGSYIDLPMVGMRVLGDPYDHTTTWNSSSSQFGKETRNRAILMEHIDNIIETGGFGEGYNPELLARAVLLHHLIQEPDNHGGNRVTRYDSENRKYYVPFDHGKAFLEWDAEKAGKEYVGLGQRNSGIAPLVLGHMSDDEELAKKVAHEMRRISRKLSQDNSLVSALGQIGQDLKDLDTDELARIKEVKKFVSKKMQTLNSDVENFISELPDEFDIPPPSRVDLSRSKSFGNAYAHARENSGVKFGISLYGENEIVDSKVLIADRQMKDNNGDIEEVTLVQFRWRGVFPPLVDGEDNPNALNRIISDLESDANGEGWKLVGRSGGIPSPDIPTVRLEVNNPIDPFNIDTTAAIGSIEPLKSAYLFTKPLPSGDLVMLYVDPATYEAEDAGEEIPVGQFSSTHGLTRILLRGDSSQREEKINDSLYMKKALNDAVGINEHGKPSAEHIEKLALDKFIKTFTNYTRADFEGGEPPMSKDEAVQEIYAKYGISPQDIFVDVSKQGELIFRLNSDAVDKIMSKNDIDPDTIVFVSNLAAPPIGTSNADQLVSIATSGVVGSLYRSTFGFRKVGSSVPSDIKNGAAEHVYFSVRQKDEMGRIDEPSLSVILDPKIFLSYLGIYSNSGDSFGRWWEGSKKDSAAWASEDKYGGSTQHHLPVTVDPEMGLQFLTSNENTKQETIDLLESMDIYEIGGIPIEQLFYDNERKDFFKGGNFENQIFDNADFNKKDVSNSSFVGATLDSASFVDATAQFVDFKDANLTDANFTGADLTGSTFRDAELRDATLGNTNLTGVNLITADLNGVKSGNITGEPLLADNWELINGYLVGPFAHLNYVNLQGSELSGNSLLYTKLEYANLKSSKFDGVFRSVNLRGADLSGSRMMGATFLNVNMRGANLSMADLSDSSISGDLFDANLFGANLSNTDLTGADLTSVRSGGIFGEPLLPEGWQLINGYLVGKNADLRSANLNNMDLSGFDLRAVNFSGANLSGSTLKVSGIGPPLNLEGANLAEATIVGDVNNVLFSGATLDGVDLRGVTGDLSQVNTGKFTNPPLLPEGWFFGNGKVYSVSQNFGGITLVDTNLDGVDLSGASLRGVGSSGITGNPVLPEGWKLVNGHLVGRGADLPRANLRDADLSLMDLRDTYLGSADLTGSNLRGANLTDAHMQRSNVDGVDLTNTVLVNTIATDLRGTPILSDGFALINGHIVGPDSRVTDANLIGEDLREVVLDSVVFGRSDLTNAVFSGSTLTGVSFEESDLTGADFSNTKLTFVDFTGADLSDVNFDGATFDNVKISGATLSGVIGERSDEDGLIRLRVVNGTVLGAGTRIDKAQSFFDADLDLSRTDFTDSDFGQSGFYGGNFSGSNFTNANLNFSTFRNVSMTDVNLSGAKMSRAAIENVDFTGADLSGIDLNNASIYNVNLDGVDLSNANLDGIRSGKITGSPILPSGFRIVNGHILGPRVASYGTDLGDADLRGVSLVSADLTGVNLSNANLENVDLHNAILFDANLFGVNLTNAILTDAKLNGNLIEATLNNANLEGVDLSGADLMNASLVGTNLRNANLRDVSLQDTDLTGADLTGADLRGAALTRVNLTNVELRNANLSDLNLSNLDMSRAQLYGANLSGANLSNTKLDRANLYNAQLQYSNLNGADLSGADLKVAMLTDASLRNAILIDADLQGADMRRADLDHAKLTGANLNGADLRKAKLTRADLEGVDLENVNLEEAILSGANLHGAKLSNAQLSGAHLSRADLSDADLVNADMHFSYLQNAYLVGADLRGANLHTADLSSANLKDTNLEDAKLTDADLTDANLRNANLQRADLVDADLTDANLTGANLIGADLADADLTGTKLKNANLSGARLFRVNLEGANLKNANLSGAYLINANLTEADLSGADLTKADLSGADLTGADLTDANLTDIYYNSQTRWPEGFSPPPK